MREERGSRSHARAVVGTMAALLFSLGVIPIAWVYSGFGYGINLFTALVILGFLLGIQAIILIAIDGPGRDSWSLMLSAVVSMLAVMLVAAFSVMWL